MRRYIQQLVDEYHSKTVARHAEAEAARRAGALPYVPPDKVDEDDLTEHFAAVEAYLEGPREGIDQPLAFYAEVDLAELPPADQLSGEEARALFEALDGLISTYDHAVELQLTADTPANLYYGYMLTVLAEPTRVMDGGLWSHGCECWAPGCEFGRYCCGLKEWYKEEFVAQGGDATIEESRFGDKERILAERAEMERRMARYKE